MMPKKQTYKHTKGGKEKESYKRAAWKATRPRKESREPEVVALQNDIYSKMLSEITISYKKGHRVGYNIHIMKKVVTLQNDDGFRVECGA